MKTWVKISLVCIVLMVASGALFMDTCMSFGGANPGCRETIPVPDVIRAAALLYFIPGMFLAGVTSAITLALYLKQLWDKAKVKRRQSRG